MKEQTVDCIFCKIAKHEVPAQIVYEDETIIAFLDITPYVKGHLLVIPKKHSRWLWDMYKRDYTKLMEKCYFLADALKKAFKTEWIEEVVAGMGVHHTHIHLMPRTEKDDIGEIPTKPLFPKLSNEEMQKIAKQIKLYLEH